jgi:CheY-like chemotaxis protein
MTPAQRGALPRLQQSGFDGYLIKPVRAASLAAQLTGKPTMDSDRAYDTPENPAAEKTSLSILVAEDNEINALLARTLLERMGHRPVVAPNGDTAFEAWDAARRGRSPFDLVLMDLHMPGTDGITATSRIRAAETGEPGKVPIVALTANAQDEDRRVCLAAGMNAFLIKPLDREKLMETIASICRDSAVLAA